MPSDNEATLAERLAEALTDRGATTMFGMPGGGPNLDMIGAAEKRGMRFVLAHGETEAAIMASTHGLLTGTPSAVVVTRGPGAAALTNGLAQATLDRFPLVAVSDTVPAASADRVAHQRIDQRSMLGPVAKVTATIGDETDNEELDRLVSLACRWPSGGVHLDFDPTATKLVSAPGVDEIEEPSAVNHVSVDRETDRETALSKAAVLLSEASCPVVIVGMEAAVLAATTSTSSTGGSGGTGGLRFVDDLVAFGCPTLTTYQAIGTVPTEHECCAGLFTNGALEGPVLEHADLIITIGLDLVEPIPAPWTREVPVIRLSADVQVDAYLPATVDLVGDVAANLAALVAQRPDRWAWETGAAKRFRSDARATLAAVDQAQAQAQDEARHDTQDQRAGSGRMGPLELVEGLIEAAPTDATVTVDAGAHFLAVMPNWPVAHPFGLLISNGLATMGFAVPAAIGASLARPGSPVIALTGDGGLSMVLAELETIARLDLPITVVVFNDSALSLIEIKQRADHGGMNAVRYRPVDFAAVAAAQGLDSHVVSSTAELAELLQPAPSHAGAGDLDAARWRRPRLIDARIDPAAYRHLINETRG